MHRLIVAAAFAAASLPAIAAACSPAWYGATEITATDAPACLAFSGDESSSLGDFVTLRARNDCDAPAVVRCPDDVTCGVEGDVELGKAFELAPGEAQVLHVPFDTSTTLGWEVEREMGTVSYGLSDSNWGDCGGFDDSPLPFCQASPGTGGDSGWLGLGLLTLVALRRLR